MRQALKTCLWAPVRCSRLLDRLLLPELPIEKKAVKPSSLDEILIRQLADRMTSMTGGRKGRKGQGFRSFFLGFNGETSNRKG
jgi:hypothetical protein